MKGRLTRQDFILFLLGIVGFLLFAALYGRLSPASAVRMEIDGKRAAEIARTFLEQQGLSFEGYQVRVSLASDGSQIMYLQRSFGPSEANTLIKEKVPAYYWEISWLKHGDIQLTVGEDEEKSETPGAVKAKVDGRGKLFNFDYSIAREDSEVAESLNQEEALALAQNFLSQNMNIDLAEYERLEEANVIHRGGSDCDFAWQKREVGLAAMRIVIGVAVQSDQVVTYDFAYAIPEDAEAIYEKGTNKPVPFIVFTVLTWVAVSLIFLVLFFIKAIRSELEFKFGLRLGVGLAILHLLGAFAALYDMRWDDFFGGLVGSVFICFGASLLWAVCDSLVRSTWREKLSVIDALGRRRFLTVEFGLATLKGYALAFLCLGFVTLLTALGGRSSLLWLTDEGITALYTSSFPFVEIVCDALILAVFIELFFRLFLASFLRGRIRSTVVVVLLSGFLLGFSGIDFFTLAPTWSSTFAMCLVACLFCYAFVRFEFITVVTGTFIVIALWKGWPLLFTGDTSHFANGFVSLALAALPLALAYISLRRGESVEQMEEYTPPYMARALERERMKQELEIARRVQRSFLPDLYPQIEGLDIAALCVPANEVGGDYYDFICSGSNRVGIVIGDVSGKGVSAAFYMALTKGLLRAEAADHESPKEILSEVNARFYENSDPNVFISMVYGVLDLGQKRFTYARAGHNPVILHRTAEGKSQSFTPPGIALGLDKGDIFEQIIAEENMDLHSGDVLVFYTDGFTEAFNWRKEEFGEERLLDLIEKHTNKSAREIVTSVEQEIQAFIGEISQRDDMTMVVVKIL